MTTIGRGEFVSISGESGAGAEFAVAAAERAVSVEQDATDEQVVPAAQAAPVEHRDSAAPEDADQFSLWVQPHWRGMSILARRLTVAGEWEDVLQESLTAAWRKRRQFDPLRGSARNWLLAITADQAAKSRRKMVPEPVAAHHDSAAPPRDPGSDLDLERVVALLTPRQQFAVTLYYFLDLPIADIAAVMSCSDGTVKSTLRDSRAKMRSLLGKDYR